MIKQLATDRPPSSTPSLPATTPSLMETRHYASYDLYWLDTITPAGWFNASNLRKLVDPTLSVSFFLNGTYLGSAGLFKLWEGVYEAWLVLLVPPPVSWEFIAHVRHAIRLGEHLTNAHRLQSYCLAEYTQGLALARRLGFKQEGVLRHATPTMTDLVVLGKVLR